MRRRQPSRREGHLLGLGEKDGGWGGVEEQTGLCSPGTHGYCMGKSEVSACSPAKAKPAAFVQLHLTFNPNTHGWKNTVPDL